MWRPVLTHAASKKTITSDPSFKGNSNNNKNNNKNKYRKKHLQKTK